MPKLNHPKHGYELMLPETIQAQTLQSISDLSPAQRAWLTRVYRGLANSPAQVQQNYAPAREHLNRIGYRPADEEIAPPRKRARKGRGSY